MLIDGAWELDGCGALEGGGEGGDGEGVVEGWEDGLGGGWLGRFGEAAAVVVEDGSGGGVIEGEGFGGRIGAGGDVIAGGG